MKKVYVKNSTLFPLGSPSLNALQLLWERGEGETGETKKALQEIRQIKINRGKILQSLSRHTAHAQSFRIYYGQ